MLADTSRPLLSLISVLTLLTLGPQARAQETVVKPPPSTGTIDAPFSMTDPDGQGLELTSMAVKVAVHGMLSLTELDLTFTNPHPRIMEGRFKAVLPADAAISRFAKEVNGQLMEGEVVERLRANQIYQEILHSMRDPALLEQDQGNQFQARIFPIPAHGTTRLLLSWSQLLPLVDGARTLEIPLRGLPTMGSFSFHGLFQPLQSEAATAEAPFDLGDLSGQFTDAKIITVNEPRFEPKSDVRITWRPTAEAPAAQSFSSGGFTLTAFRPELGHASANKTGPVSIWLDTSASSADGGQHLIDATTAMLQSLPPRMKVEIIAFDLSHTPLLSGRASEISSKLASAIRERRFLGASDLEGALRGMGDAARKAKSGSRFVLISDGIPTVGSADAGDLQRSLGSWPEAIPLHAIAPGARFDQATLKAIVADGRGRLIPLPFSTTLASHAAKAAEALFIPLGPTVGITASGAEWAFPQHFEDTRPGSELIVLSKGGKGATLTARANGLSLTGPSGEALSPAFGPLLEREAYRAYLAHLAQRAGQETDPAVKRAIHTERIKISTEQRVLCELTTLLVLETEEDYRRFGLERRGLADILVVGATGIELMQRRAPTTIAPPAPKPDRITPAKEESSILDDVAEWLKGDVADPQAKKAAEADTFGMAQEQSEERVTRRDSSWADEDEAPDDKSLEAPVLLAPAPDSAPAEAPPPPQALESLAGVSLGEDEIVGDRSSAAPSTNPTWVTQAGVVPSKAQIAAMKEAVAQSPSARSPRLKLSDALFKAGAYQDLEAMAMAWQPYDPMNGQVYESLGEALLALGKEADARRAFSSLADVSPSRPEVLVRAAMLMMRAGGDDRALGLLKRAMELRPDYPNTHRYLALYFELTGQYAQAADTLEAALKMEFPSWYGDIRRVLREELGYVYRSWGEANPDRRVEIKKRAKAEGVDLDRTEPLRVTLTWDTDANDVDLHVVDPSGSECYYSNKRTQDMTLYEDLTQGFGPEVAVARPGAKGQFHVGINYFSSGPMGVSRGLVVVRQGQGSTTLHPFRLIEGGADMRHLLTLRLK